MSIATYLYSIFDLALGLDIKSHLIRAFCFTSHFLERQLHFGHDMDIGNSCVLFIIDEPSQERQWVDNEEGCVEVGRREKSHVIHIYPFLYQLLSMRICFCFVALFCFSILPSC